MIKKINKAQKIIALINCYDTKEGKIYWINALYELKDISEGIAGFLKIYFNLL